MKFGLNLTLLLVLLPLWLLPAQSRIDWRVDSLLALMTLDEKVGQLVQYSGAPAERKELLRQGKVGSFLNVIGANATQELQRIAVEQTRLKIRCSLALMSFMAFVRHFRFLLRHLAPGIQG